MTVLSVADHPEQPQPMLALPSSRARAQFLIKALFLVWPYGPI